jgi:antitoxin CcdA
MNRPASIHGLRKATNVSLSVELVDQAKQLGINVSAACQAGLAAEVKAAREVAWKAENRESIESWNRYVREHGMPYDEYRQI